MPARFRFNLLTKSKESFYNAHDIAHAYVAATVWFGKTRKLRIVSHYPYRANVEANPMRYTFWLFKAQPSSLWRHKTRTLSTLIRSEHSATIRRRAAEIVELQVALAFSLTVRVRAVCNISWCFHFDFLLNFDSFIITEFQESSS